VSGISAAITLDTGSGSASKTPDTSRTWTVSDISKHGCLLHGTACPKRASLVEFLREGNAEFQRQCRVTRWDKEKRAWAALRFNSVLDDSELQRLGAGVGQTAAERAAGQLALARDDYRDISADIGSIQVCRSRIFVATTGSVTVSAFTVWGYHTQYPLQGSTLCTAMAGIFVVFSIGVLAMAGKARAINTRRGFLAGLRPYLTGEKTFHQYRGWAQLQQCLTECRGLRRAGVCQLGLPWDAANSCRDRGEAATAGISSHRRLVPGVLDSFTSLSAFIYSVAYVAFLALFGHALSKALEGAWGGIEPLEVIKYFGFGAVLSALVYKHVKTIGVFCLITLFLAGAALGIGFWARLIAFGCGLVLGYLGWFLSKQLYALRLGKYSFETHAYAWALVLETCNPVPTVKDALAIDVRDRKTEDVGRPGAPRSPFSRAFLLAFSVFCEMCRFCWLTIVGERQHDQVRADLADAEARSGVPPRTKTT